MSYTDLRDFEVEYTFDTGDGLVVQVEKMGGGRIGKSYVGVWRYVVTDTDGVVVARGQDFETKMPYTHRAPARAVAEYFTEEA